MTTREARTIPLLIGAATLLAVFAPLALLGLWGAELGMNRRDLPLGIILAVCGMYLFVSFIPARAAYRKALRRLHQRISR
jgi:ABC-type sulfate transport system permease component